MCWLSARFFPEAARLPSLLSWAIPRTGITFQYSFCFRTTKNGLTGGLCFLFLRWGFGMVWGHSIRLFFHLVGVEGGLSIFLLITVDLCFMVDVLRMPFIVENICM